MYSLSNPFPHIDIKTKIPYKPTNNEKFLSPSKKLDFNDVLIVPKKSSFTSRKNAKLTRSFRFKHSKQHWEGIPIVPSNMDTIGTVEMAESLTSFRMLTCLHKFHKSGNIPTNLNTNHFSISTGITEKDITNMNYIMSQHDCKFICIDVANGYMNIFRDVIKKIREKYPYVTIIAGNVVTPEACYDIIENCGADIVKIGIGSGSVCTTRNMTGVGYPQLSAIIDCKEAVLDAKGHLMSDGGIKEIGDFGKAFVAGADFVMAGGIFAGHNECGGIVQNGEQMFYGMSSEIAMDKYHGGKKNYKCSEGKCVKVKSKGYVRNTIQDILGGIRSTMTYTNSKNLEELQSNQFVIRS
jgi:GMP reductase